MRTDGWTSIAGSKSFRPDQLFRVTNKTTLLFFNIVSLYFHTLFTCELVTHRWYYTCLTAFSIWRGFCMSGRKLLDPTTYRHDEATSRLFLFCERALKRVRICDRFYPAQAPTLLGRFDCSSGDEYLSTFHRLASWWQRAYDDLICQPNLYCRKRRRRKWRWSRSMRGE